MSRIENDKNRMEQRKYNPYLLKVYNDAIEKMIQKRKEFREDIRYVGTKGDGWIICEKGRLEHSLHAHAEIPYWTHMNLYRYSYEDLLDIINFCLFLGARYNNEVKLKEIWDASS